MSAINIEKFFATLDDDNSGTVTVEELTALFKRFDKDGKCVLGYYLPQGAGI